MTFSKNPQAETVVVDSVHGDIHLFPRERRVVDTASFQRLRHLRQLGMGQVTYPNATHTRFAHSLGVLGAMEKVANVAEKALKLSGEDTEDIRLAGLLHDIGHYPYSHLMERIDKVQLTEDLVGTAETTVSAQVPYPNHEELGALILNSQEDLIDAIGGRERAQRIAGLFKGTYKERRQLCKLIHSSLDVDRLDYLLRDAHATGVPYGLIDLNYVLNNLRISPSGLLGVSEKALPAAEHCLFARFFMYRTVYFHKTTFGIEEACRQLLRRLRDAGICEIPADGNAVKSIVASNKLGEFTDAYVDKSVIRSASSKDGVIRALANSIYSRRPPKLLKEVCVFEDDAKEHHAGRAFEKDCRYNLSDLSKQFGIPLGRFLVCKTKPLKLEQRGARVSASLARKLEPEEKEELIKVFLPGCDEPTSIVDIPYSVIATCANHFFQSYRLYFVHDHADEDQKIKQMCQVVREWG